LVELAFDAGCLEISPARWSAGAAERFERGEAAASTTTVASEPVPSHGASDARFRDALGMSGSVSRTARIGVVLSGPID
jgi:hypothetical protein